MKDLTGLIISNRPDEVKTLSRAKSVPFLSNVLYHEPIGYNPIKKEPIAKLNPRRIFKSMTKQNFEMLNIKRTNFLKKKELEEQINQNKLEFDQKIKNIAVKKFKSYQLEEKEKKMNMELINMAKSLDYKTLIKNNEEIKNTFSYLRNKIEMKDNKPVILPQINKNENSNKNSVEILKESILTRLKQCNEYGQFPTYDKIEATRRVPTKKYFL